MAYTAGNLTQLTTGNGFGGYRYDTTDSMITVETAGYFNNLDDNLGLCIGDELRVFEWITAVRTGTLLHVAIFTVTNVIANDAAANAGAVNIAEVLVATTGEISSNL